MSRSRILLLIAAFLVLTLGSFIWYIATWQDRKGAGTVESALSPAVPDAPVSLAWKVEP